MTSQSPSIYSHAHARARTHASASKHRHQSPGVSWSKCVLASRAQQGQVKKKKRGRKNRNSCSVFVSHSCNTLGFHLTVFHPFIIHIGMRKLPGSSRGTFQSKSTDALRLERRTTSKPLSLSALLRYASCAANSAMIKVFVNLE